MKDAVFLAVSDRTFVGEARRRTSRMAGRGPLDEADLGRLAVVVTELAANLVDHAEGGDFFARSLDDPRGSVEVTVVDRGGGIEDIERALEDGFSTAGSAGTGLGAVRRMADAFHLHSVPDEGTVATAVVRPRAGPDPSGSGSEVGALVRPHPREAVSGDAWGLRREGGRVAVALVDGLGHGPGAEEASGRAMASFGTHPWAGPGAALERMHEALRSTRGAVGGVLELDRAVGTARFAGVGNVAASLLGPSEKRSLVSMNGTLGLQVRTVREYEYPCARGCVAVMHSDGISARWSSDGVAGVVGRHPALLCGALYLQSYRGRDDAAVIAVGERGPGVPVGEGPP